MPGGLLDETAHFVDAWQGHLHLRKFHVPLYTLSIGDQQQVMSRKHVGWPGTHSDMNSLNTNSVGQTCVAGQKTFIFKLFMSMSYFGFETWTFNTGLKR